MVHADILQITDSLLQNEAYFVEYQPIISSKDQSIYGFEALARFEFENKNLIPSDVFEALHHFPAKLNELENRVTHKQLRLAPPGVALFVNYDPHAAVDNLPALGETLATGGQSSKIVFELIEDAHELSETKRENLISYLKDRNVEIAIDDFGKEKSFFSFYLIGLSDFVKIDIFWFESAKRNPSYFRLLSAFIEFVHDQDKQVIIEGIETESDLKIAKKLAADYVQGFLYKNKFIRAGRPE